MLFRSGILTKLDRFLTGAARKETFKHALSENGEPMKVALVGLPQSGKSTLFAAVTGAVTAPGPMPSIRAAPAAVAVSRTGSFSSTSSTAPAAAMPSMSPPKVKEKNASSSTFMTPAPPMSAENGTPVPSDLPHQARSGAPPDRPNARPQDEPQWSILFSTCPSSAADFSSP